MVVRVRDDDSVVVADSDVVRVLQLSRSVSLASKLCYKRPITLENLNSVVLLVANVNESQGVSADAPWIVKLSVSRSLTTKCSKKVTTGIKDLNPVIVSVGYDELSDPVDSNAGQTVELS